MRNIFPFSLSTGILLTLIALTACGILTQTPTSVATRTNSPANTPTFTLEKTYSFSLDKEVVHVIWNEDGSLSLDYEFTFTNDAFATPIDFVDVLIPSKNYNLQDISAKVDDHTVLHIAESTFAPGAVELGLEQNAIQPGETGHVSVQINQIHELLYLDPADDQYVIAAFFPNWFGEEFTHGTTDFTITFHLPTGVQPAEPHSPQASPDWPAEPITGVDEQGRITYTWNNPDAIGYTQHLFEISFPEIYIPDNAIIPPGQLDPQYVQAYFNRGFAYSQQDEMDKAIEDYSRVIELNPKYVGAYHNRGLTYLLIGENDKALADLNMFIELDSSNSIAFLLRGFVYKEIGEREKAISDLETALELGLESGPKQDAEALLEELRH